MSNWGPNPAGSVPKPPARIRRSGGWMWAFPIAWAVSIPVWLIVGLTVVLVLPGPQCERFGIDGAIDPACAALQAQSTTDRLDAVIGWFVVYVVATAVVALLVGVVDGVRRAGVFHRRGALAIASAVIAPPHALVYTAGYGLGRLVPRRRAATSVVVARPAASEHDRMRDAPDPAVAIEHEITSRTGAPPGAVLGWSLDPNRALVTAPPSGAVLVIGPPGSGKTTSVMIPTVLVAPGACVVSSTKPDIMVATATARMGRGPVWHFDPSGETEPPPGVLAARWSPVASVRTWEDALQVGRSLAEPIFYGDRAMSAGGDPSYAAAATDWTQVLLYAAHLANQSMATIAFWAYSAADGGAERDVLEILSRANSDGDEGAVIAEQKLRGLIATPPKERGLVIATMAGLFRAYDSASARRAAEEPNFDADEFVRSNGTLYITTRSDRHALHAPLLAALLEQLRLAAYRNSDAHEPGQRSAPAHSTFVLDEADLSAPMPLPAIATEAGGRGLHLVAGILNLDAAQRRWGAVAKSFLTLFPTKVVLRGLFDKDTLAALSQASGEYEKQFRSLSVSTSFVGKFLMPLRATNPSYTSALVRQLTEGEITGIPRDHALVWDGPTWGLLGSVPYWRSDFWSAAISRSSRWRALPGLAAAPGPSVAEWGEVAGGSADELDDALLEETTQTGPPSSAARHRTASIPVSEQQTAPTPTIEPPSR